MLGAVADAHILIIDDEFANVHLLQRYLTGEGFANVRCVSDSRQALGAYVEFKPDLVLLDLHMPYLDGFAVMGQLHDATEPGDYIPIVVLTADITNDAKQRALSSGAKDFLNKPLDLTEVLLRVRNLVETRMLHLQTRLHAQELERKVRERTLELEESKIEILDRLAMAGEYRDYTTGEHTRRVANVAAALAQVTGARASEVTLLRKAAPLHDIGKIGIPDMILLKPGKLERAEFDIMKTHTTIGARILSGSRHSLLQMAETIALTHHERWDGTGYPGGLAGNSIPREGRLVAIADAFDALTHERPYKKAWPMEQVVEEIKSQSGRQFDPEFVAAFLRLFEKSDLLALAQAVPNEKFEAAILL